jgi:signal transducing adaptor molecule
MDRQKMVVKTIIDRLQLKNANVILYSMILADSLVKNLAHLRKDFASRPFLDAVVKKLNDKTVHVTLKNRILQILSEWNDSMRTDPELGYMQDVYNNLKAQGHKFPESGHDKPPAPLPTTAYSANKPNKSLEEREEEELQLALALSLSELESKRPPTPQPQRISIKGPAPPPMGSIQQAPPEPERTNLFQVRALYDFAGDASQGELSLIKGDVVSVTDTSFKDWWKGECKGRSGIFPQNYTERIKEAPREDPQLEEQVMQATMHVDRFLDVLSKIDPRRENLSENEELQDAYREMLLIRPKLVKLIESYTTKKGALSKFEKD